MTDTHVGPVIFSNRDARSYLESAGQVYTFRTRDRTTGSTHVRYERTGRKQYDCIIQKHASVADDELQDALDALSEQAGFSSGDEWRAAIREMHGEMPDEGHIYHVILPNGGRP